MRKDGIPFVPNPKHYEPPVDYTELTLSQLKKKYINTCAKANGLLSVCSKCLTPCEYGKRAIELSVDGLTSVKTFNENGVPLYDGKTLIERAKEENLKRRQEMEKKVAKDNRIYIDNWYDKALESKDPVKWVMETFNMERRAAQQKIYIWKYRHKNNKPKETTISKVEEPKTSSSDIENKMENLMKIQEEQKKAMEDYLKLYENAKSEYEKTKQKIDILCSAMDIISEN